MESCILVIVDIGLKQTAVRQHTREERVQFGELISQQEPFQSGGESVVLEETRDNCLQTNSSNGASQLEACAAFVSHPPNACPQKRAVNND